MQKIEILSPAKGQCIIKGDLTFSTLHKTSIKTLSVKFLNNAQSVPSINIDLQQLGKVDSAGLALLIEWSKLARTYQIKLRFNHAPPQLSALTKLCDISEIGLFNANN